MLRENSVRRLLLLAAVLVIPACGKSHSGFQPVAPPVLKPVAIVPEDTKAVINTAVALDGTKSYDPVSGAPPLQFLWQETDNAGTPLASPTVPSATTALLSFTAPATAQTMYFKLTVTGAQGTDSASVILKVKNFTVTPPVVSPWFVGYGNSGTIAPILSGAPVNPAYTWTGIEPWFSVVALDTLALIYNATPSLAEFQNFPDRAGVLVMERTTQGRLQLKIRVTDDNTNLANELTFDESYINFSVGPFADPVANENVALGEPVFLNGGGTVPKTPPVTITSWTWLVKKPNDQTVTLKLPNKTDLGGLLDQRYVYFVPDLLGTYEVTLTQNNGLSSETIKSVEITCGKYVGVGNLTGTTPSPFVGECASCHGGQLPWLADFANPWKQTGHARMLETILDPVNPLFTASQAKGKWIDFFNFGSNFSIDSRTVGWSTITNPSNAHGGWVQQATAEGCVLKGTTWEELVRKYPKTAAKSNVQCESCHGPGSEHAGDTTAIRKSYDANVCGRCHSDKQDHWEGSAHSSTTSAAFGVSGNTSCNGCHTAQGFIVEMRAQEGQDPHPVLFAVGNIARPVLPVDDRRSQTCQACHEPHKKTVGRPEQPGPDPQLRAYGNVKFRNDAVAFGGEAATCYMCHQSRTDTRVNSPDWNVRRAPHDSTAAEMLSSTNGMEFAGWTYLSSPHADKTRFLKLGQTEARQCLSCHVDVTPAKGEAGYMGLGGHTFRMTQGDDTDIFTTASGTGTPVAGTRKFTFSPASPISSFLRKVYPGDELTLAGTADAGTYVVDSVDSARQITLQGGGGFTGGTPTWAIKSLKKHNVGACVQCHPTAGDFRDVARGDYDGIGGKKPVQDEIQGLLAVLKTAIESKVAQLLAPYNSPSFTPVPVTVAVVSGRIKYTIISNGKVRTVPGPGVTTTENPDILWTATSTDQAAWNNVYMAAYNMAFVTNDHSEGIHNTGYSVNLLQSSYKAVTGTTILNSSPFVPF